MVAFQNLASVARARRYDRAAELGSYLVLRNTDANVFNGLCWVFNGLSWASGPDLNSESPLFFAFLSPGGQLAGRPRILRKPCAARCRVYIRRTWRRCLTSCRPQRYCRLHQLRRSLRMGYRFDI